MIFVVYLFVIIVVISITAARPIEEKKTGHLSAPSTTTERHCDYEVHVKRAKFGCFCTTMFSGFLGPLLFYLEISRFGEVASMENNYDGLF